MNPQARCQTNRIFRASTPGPLFLLILFFLIPRLLAAGNDPMRKSLVKIFTTVQHPNYAEPWRVNSQEEINGTGCVISGHRILTNAHVVSDQILIQVLKDGDTKKYTAKKIAVAHDCDLTILKVKDPKFFKGTKSIKFGALPLPRDKVSVYGYPVGGEELSITEGVVSRIELIPYSHSQRQLLGVQTDAAINPGNSGGPVFKKKKLVGIAFQAYNAIAAQNTGYFIPVPIIKRFLDEIKHGRYRGIPALGIFPQDMESDSLRAYYRMKPGQSGLLVSKVVYQSSAWNELQENDVLLSIGGYPIANDGTIPFRKVERINFQYPLCLKRIGDQMKVKILRDGKVKTIRLHLRKDVRLVPFLQYDTYPTYFIFDGLVFSPLNMNVLRDMKDANPRFISDYFDGLPSENRKQIVLVNHILSHKINKGYGPKYKELVVEKVNGVPITDMKDLVKAFDKPQEGRHVIEFEWPKHITRVVLDAAKSKQATAEILSKYNIPSDRSADLK